MSEKEPPPPEPEPDELRPIHLDPDEPAELVYVDLSGQFRTARGIGAIPVVSRTVVRVIEDMAARPAAGDDAVVHVVDLTRPDDGGGFTSRMMSPLEFEARALASLPPGTASRVTIRPAPPAPLVEHDSVFVYGTDWCGASKQVRRYLTERGVGHAFVDVDDPYGADALAGKAAAVGLIVDRVPVIDVHGRLLVGFDERRLDALLGDSL